MGIEKRYDGENTSVKIDHKQSKEFKGKVGVHNGSVLCLLLFAVVMDEVTKEVRDVV